VQESSSSSFVPKKSALSRAISSHAPSASSPLAAGSPSSSYSSAYLSELKASTPSRPSTLSYQDAVSEGLSRETMIKYGIKPEADGTSMAGLAHDSAPAIPTEAAILAAKAKRSHLRSHPDELEASSADDFIALDGRSGAVSIRDEGSLSDLAGSRLVREEDETGDGEDEHAGYTGADERVPLGKRGKKEAKRREREGIREAIEDRYVSHDWAPRAAEGEADTLHASRDAQ
jgi:GC-rich sequence DNA-binding factor